MSTPYRVPVLENFQWQQPILDKDLTAPPAATKGNRYIIGTGASGSWSTHDNQITTYDGASWLFTTPTEGTTCWVADEDVLYTWSGTSWVISVPIKKKFLEVVG